MGKKKMLKTIAAKKVAKSMFDNNMAINELRQQGYPPEVVKLVGKELQTLHKRRQIKERGLHSLERERQLASEPIRDTVRDILRIQRAPSLYRPEELRDEYRTLDNIFKVKYKDGSIVYVSNNLLLEVKRTLPEYRGKFYVEEMRLRGLRTY